MAKKLVNDDPTLQRSLSTDHCSKGGASDELTLAQFMDSTGCTFRDAKHSVESAHALRGHLSMVDGESELQEVGAPGSSVPGCRVLLVEHNLIDQKLTERILELAEVSVTTTSDGREALETVLKARDAGQSYDVVLMDMQMPLLDGYETTRVLRQQGYAGPIVALMRDAQAGDQERCLAAGCNNIELKPVRRERLLNTLLKYFGRSQRDVA